MEIRVRAELTLRDACSSKNNLAPGELYVLYHVNNFACEERSYFSSGVFDSFKNFAVFDFVRSGWMGPVAKLTSTGINGYWWSSRVSEKDYAYAVNVISGDVDVSFAHLYHFAFPLRCLAS